MKHLQPFNESENTETDSEEIDTAVRGYELYTDTGLYSLSVYLKQEVCHLLLPSYETMTIKFSEIQNQKNKIISLDPDSGDELFYFIKYTINTAADCYMASFGAEEDGKLEMDSRFEDPGCPDFYFDLLTPSGKYSLRILTKPDAFILNTPDTNQSIYGNLVDLEERLGYYEALATGGVIPTWIRFSFDRVKFSMQDSNELNFPQYVLGDEITDEKKNNKKIKISVS